ncbi:hypothetical protein COO60DRAFT_1486924 [Scenedesmus sp. NREL 46B-D3]|nr:hypothetical protein COO60DRAFT_1486924 [Scenedesmus sp. NREL 46B-D3]
MWRLQCAAVASMWRAVSSRRQRQQLGVRFLQRWHGCWMRCRAPSTAACAASSSGCSRWSSRLAGRQIHSTL